jgi:hypothetical protein
VAWVSVAFDGRGEGAEATLRTVLGYVNAHVVEAACVRVPVRREWVGAEGLIDDPSAVRSLPSSTNWPTTCGLPPA